MFDTLLPPVRPVTGYSRNSTTPLGLPSAIAALGDIRSFLKRNNVFGWSTKGHITTDIDRLLMIYLGCLDRVERGGVPSLPCCAPFNWNIEPNTEEKRALWRQVWDFAVDAPQDTALGGKMQNTPVYPRQSNALLQYLPAIFVGRPIHDFSEFGFLKRVEAFTHHYFDQRARDPNWHLPEARTLITGEQRERDSLSRGVRRLRLWRSAYRMYKPLPENIFSDP